MKIIGASYGWASSMVVSGKCGCGGDEPGELVVAERGEKWRESETGKTMVLSKGRHGLPLGRAERRRVTRWRLGVDGRADLGPMKEDAAGIGCALTD